MRIRQIEIKTDLVTKAVKLLHITDQHITGADETDTDHAKAEAARREPVFVTEHQLAEKRFESLLEYAEDKEFDGVVMTGDIIDFPSNYNIKYLSEKLGALKIPFAYATGNHDWCYADEPPREETKKIHFPEIEGAIDRNLRMDAVEIGGIIIATFDNSLFRMNAKQTEFLRKQIEKGKPLIAAFHLPIAIDTVIEPTLEVWNSPILMNVPKDIAEKYNCIFTTADAPTAEFCRLLSESKNVIGVLAGHVHFDDLGRFGDGKVQIVSSVGVAGHATAVTVMPL